jgi:hypothetical protein
MAICGSGVGACVTANKVKGVRTALVHDIFSAHQSVEDDDMNVDLKTTTANLQVYLWQRGHRIGVNRAADSDCCRAGDGDRAHDRRSTSRPTSRQQRRKFARLVEGSSNTQAWLSDGQHET